MDNRAADRHGEHGKKGFCFFQEDEDDFGLAVSFTSMRSISGLATSPCGRHFSLKHCRQVHMP